MYREVIFDIETQKLFDQIPDRERISDLKVSVVSAYKRTLDENFKEVEGEMGSFWDNQAPGNRRGIQELWSWFEGVDRVIGFNSVKFDVPVLNEYFEGDLARMPHFDLLDKIKEKLGHRLSLAAIASETVGEGKLGGGLMAVDWWQARDEVSLAKLQKYCEQDVWVTKQIYDFGMREGRLKFKDKWNELREVEVDFSYPVKIEEPQLGLF